jgi:hypothetical protein
LDGGSYSTGGEPKEENTKKERKSMVILTTVACLPVLGHAMNPMVQVVV